MAGGFTDIYGIRLLGLAKLHSDGVLDVDFEANEALSCRIASTQSFVPRSSLSPSTRWKEPGPSQSLRLRRSAD
jgi:hypothetical protein